MHVLGCISIHIISIYHNIVLQTDQSGMQSDLLRLIFMLLILESIKVNFNSL